MSAKALAFVAALLLGAGALVGFIPVSSQGVNCGSALVESNDLFASDLAEGLLGRSTDARATCTDLRSLVRIPAIVLLAGSLVMFLAASVASGRQHKALLAAHQTRSETTPE